MELRACSPNCAYADQQPEGFFVAMRAYLRRAFSDYRYEAVSSATATAGTGPAAAAVPALCSSRLRHYYDINTEALPVTVRPVCRPLSADDETQAFLNSCQPNFFISIIAIILRWFFSVTDTNAILRRGQMFVLSKRHIEELLHTVISPDEEAGGGSGSGGASSVAATAAAGAASAGPASGRRRPLKLLDVGAGDGGVTAQMAPYFNDIHCTEVSAYMGQRLRERGYTVRVTPYITEDQYPESGVFDVVSIFNVLDRTDHPAELLRHAMRLMKPTTGRLLLAVVLPFSEFVEEGTKRRRVIRPLSMAGARCGDGASFEDSLAALVTRNLIPLGLEVERIARVPYLCRGDHNRPYYVLSDAIIVAKAADPSRPPLQTDPTALFNAQLMSAVRAPPVVMHSEVAGVGGAGTGVHRSSASTVAATAQQRMASFGGPVRDPSKTA